MLDHKQTKVFYPGYQKYIEVDVGIAPLLLALWDAGIKTCNSCEENAPGIIWIEFYSVKDVEKLLMLFIEALGDQIHQHPERDDWFCFRILGHGGDKRSPWRYDAHPNLSQKGLEQRSIYARKSAPCKVELSVSVRFPVEDHSRMLELLNNYLMRSSRKFEELSDYQWEYVKRYLPPQPLKGRKRTEDRRIVNGILYILKTGHPWHDLPPRYGSYFTAQRRLKQWSKEGVLDRILSEVKASDNCSEMLSSNKAAVDTTILKSRKEGKVKGIRSIREGRVLMSTSS